MAYFPALVATPTYFPMDPSVYPVDKIVKDVGELNGGEIAALGPYKLTSFKRDEEAVFEANPNYWGKQPPIKKIIIRYFADATTMRLALEKGEIDLAFKSMNPSDIADLLKNPKYNNWKIPGPADPLSLLRDFGERVQGQEAPPGGGRAGQQARDQPEGVPRRERPPVLHDPHGHELPHG